MAFGGDLRQKENVFFETLYVVIPTSNYQMKTMFEETHIYLDLVAINLKLHTWYQEKSWFVPEADGNQYSDELQPRQRFWRYCTKLPSQFWSWHYLRLFDKIPSTPRESRNFDVQLLQANKKGFDFLNGGQWCLYTYRQTFIRPA